MKNILIKIYFQKNKKKNEKKVEVNQVYPGFFEKIYLLWSAPVTKFWINLVNFKNLFNFTQNKN